MDKLELTIQNGNKRFQPVVEGEVTWETSRKGVPGKLTFSVVKDDIVDFQEGNEVWLKYKENNVFYGFVFSKKRSKSKTIEVVAYDQLRYLKNKDTFLFENLTASEVVRHIANKFNLKTGEIDDTAYVIKYRLEENKTMFDMIQTALDTTLENKRKMYVLYDDYKKIALKDIESMKLDLIIDEDTAQDFDYASSIDGETYNQIRLCYDDNNTKKLKFVQAISKSTIEKWGVLQYFEKIQDGSNGQMMADTLLSLYNRKSRNLSISEAFGDIRVRGGSSVIVMLNLGDIRISNYMIVETVKHKFIGNEHYMNLTLRGNDFIA